MLLLFWIDFNISSTRRWLKVWKGNKENPDLSLLSLQTLVRLCNIAGTHLLPPPRNRGKETFPTQAKQPAYSGLSWCLQCKVTGEGVDPRFDEGLMLETSALETLCSGLLNFITLLYKSARSDWLIRSIHLPVGWTLTSVWFAFFVFCFFTATFSSMLLLHTV